MIWPIITYEDLESSQLLECLSCKDITEHRQVLDPKKRKDWAMRDKNPAVCKSCGTKREVDSTHDI